MPNRNSTRTQSTACSCNYRYIKKVGSTVIHSNVALVDNVPEGEFSEPSWMDQDSSLKLPSEDDVESGSDSGSSSEADSFGPLDSINSAESSLKIYSFDSSKYNSDTDKCIEFWKTIDEKTDLKPVTSTSKIADAVVESNEITQVEKEEIEEEAEEEEQQLSETVTQHGTEPAEEHLWYNVLRKMVQLSMDKLALAATGKSCKQCVAEDVDNIKGKKGKNYTEDELKDHEDLVCLNTWTSKSVKRPQKQQPEHQSVHKIEPPVEVLFPKLEIEKRIPSLTNSFMAAQIDEVEITRSSTCECRSKRCVCQHKKECETVSLPPIKPIPVPVPSKAVEIRKRDDKLVKPPVQESPPIKRVPQSKTPALPKIVEKPIAVSHDDGGTTCPNCHRKTCTCRDYFENKARNFVKTVRYELKHFRLDKACDTADYEKPKPAPIRKQKCWVCSDKSLCDIMHKKVGVTMFPPEDEDIHLDTLFQAKNQLQRTDSMTIHTGRKTIVFGDARSMHVLARRASSRHSISQMRSDLKLSKRNDFASAVSIDDEKYVDDIDENVQPRKDDEFKLEPLQWYSSNDSDID